MITFHQKAIAVFFCAAAMLMELSCIRDSYEVKLSGPVILNEQWIELRPESRLKPDKDFQWVMLQLEAPFKDDVLGEGKGPMSGKGVLTPDGETINPEVEVIDDNGNTYVFVWKGSRAGSPIYGYAPHADGLPKDRLYKTVRLRSPKPIKCKAVYWFCESAKDWK
jgi:hypothetical protein